MKNIIFDYNDKYYNMLENPLDFLIRQEKYDTIRRSYYLLNDIERNIIREIIINDNSILYTSEKLKITIEELERELDMIIELLLRLYQNSYYFS